MVFVLLRVILLIELGGGFEINGNCSYVDVDLNFLNMLEKEILMVSLFFVVTLMCIIKYLLVIGRKR